MKDYQIILGDCLEQLHGMSAGSVHCCVTSPPYYGLRDYGTATWLGGDPDCDHINHRNGSGRADGIIDERGQRCRDGVGSMGGDCKKCGATRVDQQIGLEETPEAFISRLVDVFREVRRVLADDGTLWINIGDSYYNYRPGLGGGLAKQTISATNQDLPEVCPRRGNQLDGLKEKDLIGIPWMLAFALRADGWYLRQDIIWHKPNPMPESVADRCTKSHEYVFLLSKSVRYFYDQVAIKEPCRDWGTRDRSAGKYHNEGTGLAPRSGLEKSYQSANKRSVWSVTTKPYAEAHFATFPEKLIEPCILAGTSERGHCPECGARWMRVVEQETSFEGGSGRAGRSADDVNSSGKHLGGVNGGNTNLKLGPTISTRTVAWEPPCTCGHDPIPDVVLDPFSGSGTTGVVSLKAGRKYIGLELNPQYRDLSIRRIEGDASQRPLF